MSGHGFLDDAHSAPMNEINMIPLIDVMLVLLVIFIITAPLLTHAVRIDLPQASSQPAPEKPDIVSIAINGSGEMFWNDTPVAHDALVSRLQQAATQTPQPELHLRADRETRYQVLAEIMAEAQTAGIKKMGFVSVPGQ